MLFKQKNIIHTLTYTPLILIPSVVIFFTFLMIKTSHDGFDKSIEKLHDDLMYSERRAIETKVESFSEFISYKKSVIKENLSSRVKTRVLDAYTIASGIHDKYKSSKTKREIQKLIISALRPLLWNNGESFISILDYDGVFRLAPKYLRHLEGKSIIDFQDSTGRNIIKEEIELCKTKSEGFLWNTFTKPNSDKNRQYKQVVFVKAFGHYDWYFSSGEYLDTAKKRSDTQLLESIAKIDDMGSNYILLINSKGKMLLNASEPNIVGKNIFTGENETVREIAKKFKEALKNSNSKFISYMWINPDTKKIERKYAYYKKIPQSDWVVASGYYESTIKNKVAKQSLELYKAHHEKFTKLVYIGALLILLSMTISYIISKYIKKSFTEYQDKINQSNKELKQLNETLEEKVQTRTKKLQDMKDTLEILATTDSLTKLENRYSIMNTLDVEISRAKRNSTPLCVAMYDIDMFKNINDTHGHDVGDKILIDLSNLVKNSLRKTDFLGRYGGEEFLILMPNTFLDGAIKISERVRKIVESHHFNNIEKLTISLGLVELDSNEDRETIFKRLDNLLYKSKESGRNRLSF